MEIKVLGDGCAHCNVLYTHTLQAVEELGLDVPVAQVSDVLQILQYRVLSTPALVVDGKVVSAGEVLSVKDIEKILDIKTRNADADVYDAKAYRTMAATQFLKGYAEKDTIYD